MESFYFIAQKIMNPNMEPFIYTSDFESKYNFALRLHSQTLKKETYNIFNVFFYQYVLYQSREVSKFKILHSIYENVFFSNQLKEYILNLFCSIQKINNAFSRLAYIHKFKKAAIVINHDMFLNPIESNQKTTMTIYDSCNGSKYLFSITDLIQIIKKSLVHSPNFFSDPLECKNPYTNIAFNKTTLYNIYFFIRHKNYIIPQVIQNYFLSNFHLENFRKNNLFIIREEAIKDFVNNLLPNDVADYVDIMLKNYFKKKTYIHPDFPKSVLGNIMRPYLHYYLIATNSLCFEKRYEYSTKLRSKLERFFKFNPNFGKKYLKFEKSTYDISSRSLFVFDSNGKSRKHIVFDDKHINFHEKKNELFSTSHLKPNDFYYNNNNNHDDADAYEDEDDSLAEYSVEDDEIPNQNQNQNQNSHGTTSQINAEQENELQDESEADENEAEQPDNAYTTEMINELLLMELGLINQTHEDNDEDEI